MLLSFLLNSPFTSDDCLLCSTEADSRDHDGPACYATAASRDSRNFFYIRGRFEVILVSIEIFIIFYQKYIYNVLNYVLLTQCNKCIVIF